MLNNPINRPIMITQNQSNYNNVHTIYRFVDLCCVCVVFSEAGVDLLFFEVLDWILRKSIYHDSAFQSFTFRVCRQFNV